MIIDVVKNSNSSEIKKYLTYCISPKTTGEELKNYKVKDLIRGERVASFYSNEMLPRPSKVDEFVDLLDKWTRDMKSGRPATSKTPKVYMGSFAFHPDDDVTPSKAIDIVRKRLFKDMGGAYRPGVFVCHWDKDHLHVHFVVAAVGADGLVYDPAGRGATFRAFEMMAEKIEVAGNFTPVKQRKAMEATDPKRALKMAAPKGIDLQKLERTGVESTDLKLNAALKIASKSALKHKDFGQFLDDLQELGVRTIPNIKQGKMAGFAFVMADAPIEHRKPAGDFGLLFKWPALAKGLHYEHDIYFERLQALKASKGIEPKTVEVQDFPEESAADAYLADQREREYEPLVSVDNTQSTPYTAPVPSWTQDPYSYNRKNEGFTR
jgi:hypothetical protein